MCSVHFVLFFLFIDDLDSLLLSTWVHVLVTSCPFVLGGVKTNRSIKNDLLKSLPSLPFDLFFFIFPPRDLIRARS